MQSMYPASFSGYFPVPMMKSALWFPIKETNSKGSLVFPGFPIDGPTVPHQLPCFRIFQVQKISLHISLGAAVAMTEAGAARGGQGRAQPAA
jgi:hypothetical protein